MIVVNKSDNSGFSLIELLTVVILIGILGVIALGRLGNQDGIAARGFFDDTVTAVRFAQKLAISTGCPVRVVTTATSYRLFQQATDCTTGAFTRTVANPANRSLAYENIDMPAGFSLTAGNITFNSRGIRTEAAPDTFTMTDGTQFTFDVHESTGLVEVLN